MWYERSYKPVSLYEVRLKRCAVGLDSRCLNKTWMAFRGLVLSDRPSQRAEVGQM
jgi:hypothetical protein